MSSSGAKADRSTVSATSLGDSNPDEYTAVKNTNAHVSGKIEEVAPHDDDEETTTTQTTTTTKQHKKHHDKHEGKHEGKQHATDGKDVSQMASESWEAAKIKGAEAVNAAKDKINEYTDGGNSESSKDDAHSTGKQAKSAVKDASNKAADTASSASKAASDAADTASKKASETASAVSQKASETASAASAKAGDVYNQAHDAIKAQTGSDKPLREQASDAAAVAKEKATDAASTASVKASEAASSASETASQYGAAAQKKAGEAYNQAHDAIQQQTGSDQPLRQQAATKASEWATTLEAAAETAKEKIVEYAGIAQAKAAEAYKSASSSSAVSSVSSMLGMSSGDADKSVTTTTYESRETIVDKDEATGTAKVSKHETWTEQTDNGPKKENSKDSQYTTQIGKDGKL